MSLARSIVMMVWDGPLFSRRPHEDSPPYSFHSAWIYDAARSLSLLLPGLNPNTFQPNTGLYSQDTLGWKALTWNGASPPPAYQALGACDPARGRDIFLIRADANSAYTWQTWEWTGTNWDAGPLLQNAEPDSFTFDKARGVGFLAGQDPATHLEAVWLYTPGATAALGSWSRVTITGDPYNALINAPLVFDPIRDRVIRCMGRFQGNIYGYIPEIDVWNWAQSTWNRTDYSNDLPYADARAGSGVAYDLARDRLVIYGGITVSVVNGEATTTEWTDTWEQEVLDVLYVDAGNTGTQDGTAAHPYRTVRQAAGAITSCIRDISIQSGDYPESPLTLNTPVTLVTRNGPATLH